MLYLVAAAGYEINPSSGRYRSYYFVTQDYLLSVINERKCMHFNTLLLFLQNILYNRKMLYEIDELFFICLLKIVEIIILVLNKLL